LVALRVVGWGCILRQKSTTYSMVGDARVTSLFSRFVFHITGVAVMVLAVSSADTLTRNGSNMTSEPRTTYSLKSGDYCMRDLEIDVGHIGQTIVALCADRDFEYAFHAMPSNGRYLVQMSSTHGIITTGRFDLSTPARQLILQAMNNHLQAISQLNKPTNVPIVDIDQQPPQPN